MEENTQQQEAEWAALAAEQERFDGRNCGVSYVNKPHPASVGAHLPMSGIGTLPRFPTDGQSRAIKRKALALWPDQKFRRAKAAPESLSRIKKDAAHPDSPFAHLPLRGLGLEGSDPVHTWTLTVAEKRQLAARPVRYVVPTPAAA